MELVWLEDFVALAEHGGFIRAAQARHVTQPAFSRRIRALEQWMGVALFVRTAQGATLTPAGAHVLLSIQDAATRLYRIRDEAREVAGAAAKSLRFAATHSLSFTFFPRWIREAGKGAPIQAVQLQSDSMAECERMLSHGKVQFLLCHRHPQVPPLLPAGHYISKAVGSDTLIPLMGAGLAFTGELSTLPYLAYTKASGLGRIVAHHLKGNPQFNALQPSFSSHLAAVLTSIALENKGVAWLPQSLTEQECADQRLVRALDEGWDIPLQVHLTRPVAPLTPFAEAFWAGLG
ncbi:LysR family transcriptional regulator [Pseudomonas sp. NPDC007930]|uniref:LysR family transcriptional regulator n=1 Tax=Pseudomonas sp. NPDC007930 TaxID=3364417 RepID=UPI0036EEC0DF